MCGQILSQLGYDEQLIDDVMTAAVLHDIGSVSGKEGHSYRSYEMAKEYIESRKIELKYKERVLEAIRLHSDGFDSDDIIALTLILCDKLDLKKTRIAPAGYEVRGMRQLQYINDIVVVINDKCMSVDFQTDGEFDRVEFEEFYFVDKVFKSAEAFARKLGIDYIVSVNGEKWQLRQ